jgi:uncharacterized protein (DUF952 family)
MAKRIYKACREQDFHSAVAAGVWAGSADDLRDGFIHFSLAHQLETTLRKYFADRQDLLVVSFDPDTLGDALRYEPSRNGDLFPHLYAALDPRLALAATPLRWRDGRPLLEELLAGDGEG